MNYHIIDNISRAVALKDIPTVGYAALYDDLRERLKQERYHVAHYFALPDDSQLRFYVILLDDEEHRIMLASFTMDYYDDTALPSLTALHPAMHPFEREIAELYDVKFDSMPWNKPLRFSFDRRNRNSTMDNYPFYTMEGGSLHEVNVGPIHAGIIEPGAFRFICNGEQVLHLEIALGYQHRGVEHLFEHTDNLLRRMCLAETVAGDSAVAHATAFAEAVEKLTARERSAELERERTVALELERMAMQIADTGALSMDVGYQLGQVACEALRTLTINTTQAWCGNRFGKGLVRPHGTDHPLTPEKARMIRRNVGEIARRNREREFIHLFGDVGWKSVDQNRVDFRQVIARDGHGTTDSRTLERHGIENRRITLYGDLRRIIESCLDERRAIEITQRNACAVGLDIRTLDYQFIGRTTDDRGFVAGGLPLGRKQDGFDSTHILAGNKHLIAHIDR